ncbi:hypothetical protein FRC03_008778 [Tulasnella sp. 419]|nr:hypothetical protein FRC03_008778 [Tulasnella sp. 419]
MKFVVGAPKALHLQTRLSSLGTSVSYALIRKPKQGLEIIREGPVLLHLSWDKRHKEMVEYLHKIGSSDDIQKAVLGVHYRNLMRLLDGENVQVGSPTMTSLPSLSTSRRASNTASSSKEVPKAKDRARVVSDSRQRKRKRSDSEDDEMDDT